jgi:addiction module RelE/StbE family toxin
MVQGARHRSPKSWMRQCVNRELIRTTRFVRALRRYLKRHRDAEPEVREALELLSADAFDPRLKTHKLTGELTDVWACSAGYDLRILFEFVQNEGEEAILLLTMGTHDEVY